MIILYLKCWLKSFLSTEYVCVLWQQQYPLSWERYLNNCVSTMKLLPTVIYYIHTYIYHSWHVNLVKFVVIKYTQHTQHTQHVFSKFHSKISKRQQQFCLLPATDCVCSVDHNLWLFQRKCCHGCFFSFPKRLTFHIHRLPVSSG